MRGGFGHLGLTRLRMKVILRQITKIKVAEHSGHFYVLYIYKLVEKS